MPESLFPSIEPSFLVPTVMPMTVDPDEAYPFRDFFGRDEETRTLRRWLMGADQVGNGVYPRGGAVLVTGFRGVGKTALVNKALFDVGTAALYGLELGGDEANWGPFEHDALRRSLRQGPLKRFDPTLFIPIRVEVANALDGRSLLNRIIRRTYFALTRHEIGNARPDVMRRIRLAYVRTLGEITSESSRKLSGGIGLTLDQLGKLEVTASQEYEFAETLHLAAAELSAEEAEEELLDLGSALSESRVGISPSVGRLAVDVIQRGWRRGLERLNQVFRTHQGLRVHLVYVFDELDKLEDEERAESTRVGVELAWGTGPGTLGRTTLVGQAELPSARHASTALRTALAVVGKIKSLLTSEPISAVAIGGAALEEAWQRERTSDDPILPSLFGWHVYVPQVNLEVAHHFLAYGKVGDLESTDTARALCYLSRGRYKNMIRLVYWLQRVNETNDELALRRLRWAAELVGDWGATAPSWGGTETAASTLIEACDSIEALIGAIVQVGFMERYANEYGLDVLRSLLVCMAGELSNHDLLTSDSVFAAWRDRLAEEVPGRVAGGVFALVATRLRAILQRQLIGGDGA